jgi:hypothetical protein
MHLLAHNDQGTELTVGRIGTSEVCAAEEMKGAAEGWQGRAEVQLVLQGAAAGCAGQQGRRCVCGGW